VENSFGRFLVVVRDIFVSLNGFDMLSQISNIYLKKSYSSSFFCFQSHLSMKLAKQPFSCLSHSILCCFVAFFARLSEFHDAHQIPLIPPKTPASLAEASTTTFVNFIIEMGTREEAKA
jgi:hypothetical protein